MPMKIYREHGAMKRWLRDLQRKGSVELVHFAYDCNSHTPKMATAAVASEGQIQDLNLPISELPGTLKDYCASEHLPEILEIVGARHRQDALHVDTALKVGCSAFVTCDTDILAHKQRLEAVVGIRLFNPDTDRDELEQFVSQNRGAA